MNRSLKQLGTILALSTALFLTGCGGEKKQEATSTEENVVLLSQSDLITARRGTLATGVTITGSLEPYKKVEVKAQVPGIVRNLRIDRGQAVRAGATIASIEAEGIRNQATSAQAAVAMAQAQASLAQQQYESAKTLHEAGALSALDFKAAQTAYEAAQQQLTAARAQATGAREQAGRTTVSAPLSGVVSDRQVENGEAINPAQTIVTIVSTDELELYGQVPVESASRIKVGQAVTFTLDAYPGQTYRGTVARIEPTADPMTRQVGVYLRLPNPGRTLVGGLFATGRVVGEELKDVITVPATAVSTQGGQTAVFVVKNNVIERRVVTLGARDDMKGVVAIASGVTEGEHLLATPSNTTPEGTRVRLASDAGTPPVTRPTTNAKK